MRITESRLRRLIKSVIEESVAIEKKESNDDFVKRLGFANIEDTKLKAWFNSVNPDRNQGYDGRKSGFGGAGALFGNATNNKWVKRYYDKPFSDVLKAYDIDINKTMAGDPDNIDNFLDLFDQFMRSDGTIDSSNREFKYILYNIIIKYKKNSADASYQHGLGQAGISKILSSGVTLGVLKKMVHSMEETYNQVNEEMVYDVDEEGYDEKGREFMKRYQQK